MLNIAHRGASGHAPENTMAAFRKAVELGANGIETDLRITFDGHVIAMHDDKLFRTTGVRSNVATRTLKQIRELDAAARFAGTGSARRQRVPTLAEILAYTNRRDMTSFLELKWKANLGLEAAVVRGIQAAKALDRVVVISFNEQQLRIVKEIEPKIVTGLLRSRLKREVMLRALGVQAKYVLGIDEKLTPQMIAEIRDAGLKVVAWTVNDPARMRELIRAGVDGIITDYPDRLDKVIREVQTIQVRRSRPQS